MNLKDAALLAHSEFEAEQAEARRVQLATSAEETVEMLQEKTGYTAQSNAAEGTAEIDGLVFKRRREHGDWRLVVAGICYHCRENVWLDVVGLSDLGKLIENDLIGLDGLHHCKTKPSQYSLGDMIREIVRDEVNNQ